MVERGPRLYLNKDRPTLSGHYCSFFDLVGNKITDSDKLDKFRTISPTVNVAWSIFVSSIHENWSDMTILFYTISPSSL